MLKSSCGLGQVTLLAGPQLPHAGNRRTVSSWSEGIFYGQSGGDGLLPLHLRTHCSLSFHDSWAQGLNRLLASPAGGGIKKCTAYNKVFNKIKSSSASNPPTYPHPGVGNGGAPTPSSTRDSTMRKMRSHPASLRPVGVVRRTCPRHHRPQPAPTSDSCRAGSTSTPITGAVSRRATPESVLPPHEAWASGEMP